MKKIFSKFVTIFWIFQIVLAFAFTIWLYVEIRKDPANAATLPIFAFVVYIAHITSKQYRTKMKKEAEETDKEIEEIAQKYLDRKEDEK